MKSHASNSNPGHLSPYLGLTDRWSSESFCFKIITCLSKIWTNDWQSVDYAHGVFAALWFPPFTIGAGGPHPIYKRTLMQDWVINMELWLKALAAPYHLSQWSESKLNNLQFQKACEGIHEIYYLLWDQEGRGEFWCRGWLEIVWCQCQDC